MQRKHLAIFSFLTFLLCQSTIGFSQVVDSWQTSTNKNKLFEKQSTANFVEGTGNNAIKLTVNDNISYQTIEGFGWTMTQGSAYMIKQLSDAKQKEILEELFSIEKGMGSATVRVALGASDLGQGAYTYQDDENKPFSLAGPDLDYLIPILKEMIKINPNIKFMATPWSAPAWMKTAFSENGKQQLRGGSLKKDCYGKYAEYILKYFQTMRDDHGIRFHSMTIQNEPLTEHNWPSMYMNKESQYDFVQNYLGPTLKNNGFAHIKLIGYDHNCDNTEYPIHVAKSEYIDGSAFHLYGGDISALSTVYNTTKKNVYFTEQWTGGNGSFSTDFSFHMREVMIGAVNNFTKVSLAWNVASDQNWDPHTDDGGCDLCMGALTIHNTTKAITRNVTYYTTAQMSKVTKDGSVRVASTVTDGSLVHTAFINPDGTLGLVIFNTGNSQKIFDIVWNGKSLSYTLSGNTVTSILTTPLIITDPVTGVEVSPMDIEVDKYKTVQLTAAVIPENATLKTVRWSSNNTTIAMVDDMGKVRGRKAGDATITATTVDGGFTSSCVVTVRDNGEKGEFPDIYNVLSVYSAKGLDVKDLNMNPGAGLQQWEVGTDGGGNNQQWSFDYIGDDIYYIRSMFSGLFLTVNGVSDGSSVTQEEYTGDESQEWKITLTDNNSYKIINVMSEKALDVEGPSTNNGANVHTWTYGGGENQKWIIQRVRGNTHVDQINGNDNWIVYPNPTHDIVYVRFTSKGNRILNLFNISGELLNTKMIETITGEFDLSGFAGGIYILQAKDGKETVYTKILKIS